MDETTSPELKLPGFRFHPTEEELLNFYLKNMILGKIMSFDIITYVNIYQYDPPELPGMANIKGEREWYFFVPRDRKHGSGGRPNRTTERGFWKATGSDRKVVSLSEPKRVIGLRKTLVFYTGRAPKGTKTDWVMNEYRLPDNCNLSKETVLCKVYRKATSLKVLEERVKMEEHIRNFQSNNASGSTTTTSPTDTCLSFSGPQQEDLAQLQGPQLAQNQMPLKTELEEVEANIPSEKAVFEKLPNIQVPNKLSMDWNTQDPLWIQMNSPCLISPWLQNLTTPYSSNILNFNAYSSFT